MRRILPFFLICSLLGLTNLSFGQATTCTPDMDLFAAGAGIYPLPDSTTGGDLDPICPGQPYEFVFQAVVPDSISVPGFPTLPLSSITLDASTAIGGLPTGIDYYCNPPDCVFEPSDSVGCVILSGITNDPAGQYDLVIEAEANIGFPLTVEFPGPIFPGLYWVDVLESTDPACNVIGTNDVASLGLGVSQNTPNPFSGRTQIEVTAEDYGTFTFQVFGMTGAVVHKELVEFAAGTNVVEFDGSALQAGVYTYTFSNDQGVITKRMVINR